MKENCSNLGRFSVMLAKLRPSRHAGCIPISTFNFGDEIQARGKKKTGKTSRMTKADGGGGQPDDAVKIAFRLTDTDRSAIRSVSGGKKRGKEAALVERHRETKEKARISRGENGGLYGAGPKGSSGTCLKKGRQGHRRRAKKKGWGRGLKNSQRPKTISTYKPLCLEPDRKEEGMFDSILPLATERSEAEKGEKALESLSDRLRSWRRRGGERERTK